MMNLKIRPDPIQGPPGVSLGGEIDMSNARDVQEALDAAIHTSVGVFVIDLCDVAFLDSTAVRLMLRARAQLGRQDRELAVICPPGPVRRVFELAGVSDLLSLFPTRAAAAAALIPPA
jgi:anti-sigma B factor antagonist